MNDKTKNYLKHLINEVLIEMHDDEFNDVDAARERGHYDAPPEPQDSVDDFESDYLTDLVQTVDDAISDIESENSNSDRSFQKLEDIYKQLTDVLNGSHMKGDEYKRLQREYEPLLKKISRYIHNSGSGGEKVYVKETNCTKCKGVCKCNIKNEIRSNILKEKAPPGYSEDTMHKIKSSLRRAHPNWSDKKIMGVAFATAWKHYYKKSK